jgi:hypothetical protein
MALPWAAVIFALLKKHSPPYTFGPGIAGLLIYHYCPGAVRVLSGCLRLPFYQPSSLTPSFTAIYQIQQKGCSI